MVELLIIYGLSVIMFLITGFLYRLAINEYPVPYELSIIPVINLLLVIMAWRSHYKEYLKYIGLTK
jgi:hypothetical protein